MASAPSAVGADPSGELRQRLVSYILFRLVLATALLVYAALLLGARVAEAGPTLNPELALWVAAFTYAVLGVSAFTVRRIARLKPLVLVQLGCDSIVVGCLVVLFGGTGSPFVPLFPAAVLGAAFLYGRRGALISAFINAAMLVIIAWAMSGDGDAFKAFAVVITEVFGVFLVGLLAGELSSKLLAQTNQAKALQKDLSQVLTHLRAGLVLVDNQGVLRTANSAAMDLFPALSERPVEGTIPGYSLGQAAAAWELEGAGTAQDRTLLVSASPTDEGGAVLVIEDVTELRETQRQGAREERLRAAGRFSQGIAHEIKNPLTSLSGALQLMDLSESDKRLRKIVLREVERLNRLVSDFRDAGQSAPLSMQRCELSVLAAEVVEAFSHDPRYKAARVALSTEQSFVLLADGDQLKQVLWNLLLNAAQHMPDGGEIQVALRAQGEAVVLSVQDQGVGISAEQLPLIFDPFFTRRSGGTGLGLAVVERVVRDHGGELGVKSEPKVGTRFWIRLPLAAQEERDD